MKPLEPSLNPATKMVDVEQFFVEITMAYGQFEGHVLYLLARAEDISPATIFEECQRLGVEHKRLAHLDEQLLAILSLAGREVAETAMIHDYRMAFAKASMACSNLQQKLLAIRATLAHAGAAMQGSCLVPCSGKTV